MLGGVYEMGGGAERMQNNGDRWGDTRGAGGALGGADRLGNSGHVGTDRTRGTYRGDVSRGVHDNYPHSRTRYHQLRSRGVDVSGIDYNQLAAVMRRRFAPPMKLPKMVGAATELVGKYPHQLKNHS